MDKRDALKRMLNNLINDKPEEASLDLHNYMTDKMRDVAGLEKTPAEDADRFVDINDDDNLEIDD